jgi:hypothetical protein
VERKEERSKKGEVQAKRKNKGAEKEKEYNLSQ